jgi:TPR repeat protein
MNPIAQLREIKMDTALARNSIGGLGQYCFMFPGAERGVNDLFLGEYLSAGKMLNQDRSQALRTIEALAYRGSPLSMLFVADAMRNGGDYEVDLEKPEGWYRHAASHGSGRAMYGIGLIHLTRRDMEKAVEAFEAAGERGCGAAMWVLGLLYRRGGAGIPPDIDKARALLARGASQGHVWSSRTMSVVLMSGRYGLWARLRGYATYLAAFFAAPIAIVGGRVDRVMR